jgi:hypothetical protein
VAAQVVHLIREGEGKTDVADCVFNTLDLSPPFSQMFIVWTSVERSLQSFELAIQIKQSPPRDPIIKLDGGALFGRIGAKKSLTEMQPTPTRIYWPIEEVRGPAVALPL